MSVFENISKIPNKLFYNSLIFYLFLFRFFCMIIVCPVFFLLYITLQFLFITSSSVPADICSTRSLPDLLCCYKTAPFPVSLHPKPDYTLLIYEVSLWQFCTTVKNRYPGAEYFLNRLTHQWIMRAAKNNCIHFSFLVRCKQILRNVPVLPGKFSALYEFHKSRTWQ